MSKSLEKVLLTTNFKEILLDPEIDAVAQRIASLERKGDAILQLNPSKGESVANSYQGALPLYGFFNQNQLSSEDAAWLARLEQTYMRLWVAPDGLPPDQSGWERPLRIGDFVLIDDRVSGPNNQRVALSALAPAHKLVEAGVGEVLVPHLLAVPVHQVEDVVLGFDVVVDAARAEPGGLGDLAHRGLGVSLLFEDGDSPFDDGPSLLVDQLLIFYP